MQNQNTKLDRINHIALPVADIEAAIRWYQTSFSCEVLTKDSTFARLRFDNIELVLVLPAQEPTHIALYKQDAATFGELRLRKDGSRSTYVADPTGNIVELLAGEVLT